MGKLRLALDELSYDVLPNGHVLVQRLSPLTREVNRMEIPITEEQLMEFCQDCGRNLIQRLLPTCNADQREFLKTGYTPADWDVLFVRT